MSRINCMTLKIIFLLVSAASIILSCKKTNSSLESVPNNLSISDEGFTISNAQCMAEFENYKIEVQELLIENDTFLINFKLRLIEESKESNPYYNRQITDLELENRNMKLKLDTFQPKSKEDWEAFKIANSREMIELRILHKNLKLSRSQPVKIVIEQ